jgi:hypothetical protein
MVIVELNQVPHFIPIPPYDMDRKDPRNASEEHRGVDVRFCIHIRQGFLFLVAFQNNTGRGLLETVLLVGEFSIGKRSHRKQSTLKRRVTRGSQIFHGKRFANQSNAASRESHLSRLVEVALAVMFKTAIRSSMFAWKTSLDIIVGSTRIKARNGRWEVENSFAASILGPNK